MESQAEGAYIEYTTVILGWEISVVPSFHRSLAELKEFDRLETCRIHKVPELLLTHARVFVMRKEGLLLFLTFLQLILLFEVFEKVIDQFIIDAHHVLFNPTIHGSLLLDVVHVVFDRLVCFDHLPVALVLRRLSCL